MIKMNFPTNLRILIENKTAEGYLTIFWGKKIDMVGQKELEQLRIGEDFQLFRGRLIFHLVSERGTIEVYRVLENGRKSELFSFKISDFFPPKETQ